MNNFTRLSSMQKTIIGLAVLVLIGVGGYFGYTKFAAQGAEQEGVVCTMEAMMCPDGVTYVGRTGPHCEFAACPTATTTPTQNPVTQTTTLNKKIVTLGVTVIPLEVVEDSRCPTDVQCIQAGTVRVKTSISSGLGEYTATLTLGKPLTTEAEIITLVAVTPTKISTHQTTSAEYVFTFKIEKR